MHTSAECNMTRVERNCGKEGSSWYFTMKSIFKIHQSTAKILQVVLRIVHPLNPPILSVHPSLLTLSFSSRARLSNSKKKKGRIERISFTGDRETYHLSRIWRSTCKSCSQYESRNTLSRAVLGGRGGALSSCITSPAGNESVRGGVQQGRGEKYVH